MLLDGVEVGSTYSDENVWLYLWINAEDEMYCFFPSFIFFLFLCKLLLVEVI